MRVKIMDFFRKRENRDDGLYIKCRGPKHIKKGIEDRMVHESNYYIDTRDGLKNICKECSNIQVNFSGES
jgi:hypothetical protein